MTWLHFASLRSPLRAKMCRWAEFEGAADADVKLAEENSSSPQPDPYEQGIADVSAAEKATAPTRCGAT